MSHLIRLSGNLQKVKHGAGLRMVVAHQHLSWIAIGGWDFNDPGPTRITFSDMASTAANRAAFISSLQNFMSKYGFQGVHIDREYPGAPDRLETPADTQNFVQLLKEMRSAFGTTYGISVTLPSSYWYLRWFNPVAMESYINFFGLMTYDLHGPWDINVKDIGPTIIGQTNIPEIYNWTLPLWYDNVDPSKINIGPAHYGRGYTVENVDCTTVGCKWSGPSRPAPCTNFGSVMSLKEIQHIILPQIGVKPILDSTAMMKYLAWSDQWVGYDDADTIAMKKAWASSHCFGGSMIWSIDLYSGIGSGNTPDGNDNSTSTDPGSGGGNDGSTENGGGIVYIDPSIWKQPNPVISCQPPCTFVLPPYPLSSTSTVTFPPFVTSLDVAWSTSTGWTRIIKTTTLIIPPVTITEIPVWEFSITSTAQTSAISTLEPFLIAFYPTSNISPPPFIIVDDPNPQHSSKVSHPPVTRTIYPPPYPYSFVRPTSSSTHTEPAFPRVTFKPGPPGPICKSGCGEPCLIFCAYPCLLNCPDGGNDFPDPPDPNPPLRPTPTEVNSHLPTSTLDPVPTDNGGNTPQDPDEEDEDEQCALEFHQPAPTYVNPNFGAGTTQSIAPAPSPPTSPPAPNPTPPSPNPSTESLHCFNSGAMTDRGRMIDVVDTFCNFFSGRVLDASDVHTEHTLHYSFYDYCLPSDAGCFGVIQVSVTVINGCRFTMHGPAPDQSCGRILRGAIDRRDTSSTRFKQGGTITSNCAKWDIDPNVNI